MFRWLAVFVVLVAGCPAAGISGWFGPSDYDECILENMQGVESDMAARYVHVACRRMFPEEKKEEEKSAPPCRDGANECKPWERDWESGKKGQTRINRKSMKNFGQVNQREDLGWLVWRAIPLT